MIIISTTTTTTIITVFTLYIGTPKFFTTFVWPLVLKDVSNNYWMWSGSLYWPHCAAPGPALHCWGLPAPILRINTEVQSTLFISKSKGLSEILRDIRTSTYQICKHEEKINRATTF